MKNRYVKSLLTSCLSILPIVVVIFILSLTGIAPIGSTFTSSSDNSLYILLGIGAAILIVGLTLFQLGASRGLIKVGEYMGSSLSKQTRLFLVILFSFLLGTLITCAEPSILIVSKQISIDKFVLIGSISAGVGIFVVIGILRVMFQKSLNYWYIIFYLIVFLFICLLQVDEKNHAFLPFIFDAGGVTTGSATVPFILALGAGVATVRGGKNSRDNSFGLVGMASIGPIITMTLLILLSPSGFNPYKYEITNVGIFDRFVNALLPDFSDGKLVFGSIIEVAMALLPILAIFMVYELLFIKLPLKKIGSLLFGFFISFVGLVLFLCAVNAAMTPIGQEVGKQIASNEDWIIILIGFAIGLVTILCEPAVHVLTTQIETLSDGQIKKVTVLLALSLGVGVAICLAITRSIFKFSIMYIIIPGYLVSFIMMFLVPDVYTAIAFDSGGTASGPMAVSFVLPLIIGLYATKNGIASGESSVDFYEYAFGVVALIAMTPIIAIQALGLWTKQKERHALRLMRSQDTDIRNNEIIHFN